MLVIWNKVLNSIAKHNKEPARVFRAERSPSFRKGEELLDCESGNEEPGEAEGAHDNTSDCLRDLTPLNLERENGGEHSEWWIMRRVLMVTMDKMWMHFINVIGMVRKYKSNLRLFEI